MINKAKFVIVDYGMGNIRSVHNALERMGASVSDSHLEEDLIAADALILPGVGAFGEAIANLKARGLVQPLLRAVKLEGKPLLGICLGMQLLADSSEERGLSKGLSLIPGEVRRLPVPAGLRLPHIGWNTLSIKKKDPLFVSTSEGEAVYFVHSYHFVCDDADVAATTDYGGDVVAAVQRGNVFGVQFHPERSQSKGLALLGNFVDYVNRIRKGKMPC
jgi:glutamine amidotransferase